MTNKNLTELYPDFLVVGAAKSGTSSLHRYFEAHPDILMPFPTKELNFFHLRGHEEKRAILRRNRHLPTNELSYLGHFYNKKHQQISGECSPSYLYYYQDTIDNIKAVHPNYKDLKIIIILREPISKIWSHYKFVRMHDLDPDDLSLEEALSKEEVRSKDYSLLLDLLYVANTSYYKQVKAFLDNFSHVKVVLYEELKSDPNALMKKLYEFLGVKPIKSEIFGERVNVSRNVENYRIKVLKKVANHIPAPIKRNTPKLMDKALKTLFITEEKQMLPSTKQSLARIFLPEVEKLQQIIEPDVSDWISKYHEILNNG